MTAVLATPENSIGVFESESAMWRAVSTKRKIMRSYALGHRRVTLGKYIVQGWNDERYIRERVADTAEGIRIILAKMEKPGESVEGSGQRLATAINKMHPGKLPKCTFCEKAQLRANLNFLGNGDEDSPRPICSSCYASRCYRCDRCLDIYELPHHGGEFGYRVCEGCAEYIGYCDSHHAPYLGEDCPACSREQESIRIVHGYSTNVKEALSRPHLIDTGERAGDDHLMGVEVECCSKPGVLNSNYHTKIGEAIRGVAIMKSDSSIRGQNPVEIVTLPATLAYHRKWFLGENWARVQTIAGAWNNDSCGLHVHIGRKRLTNAHFDRILWFVHSLENYSFMIHMAGRAYNHYWFLGPDRAAVSPHVYERGFGRYVAVNFAKNETIEFRLFRGNTSGRGILKNVEFVHALAEYSSPANETWGQGFRQFAAWVQGRGEQYPTLLAWLESFQYAPHNSGSNAASWHELATA